jgi:hypothetical protein
MTWNRRTLRGTWGLLLVSTAVTAFMLSDTAATRQSAARDPDRGPPRPSLSDPKHLWNRLRHRLHVRVEEEIAKGPDQIRLDPNEHDPLHWSRIWFPEPVDYLVTGTAQRDAIALLDEFLNNEGEKLETDPLQRALLQHDLWAVFDYVSNPGWLEPHRAQPESKLYRTERRELYRRLARAIDRLALTKEEIGRLPDNYAAAVAARKYTPQLDPARPGEAFLPANLWEPEGPWVLLSEWAYNPLAIRHTAFFGGRSTFAVFLRLPAGRDATVKYLKELREWKPKRGDDIPPNGKAIPPQVPPETQFALARRMMLVSDTGAMVPTRVTESLQVRVLPNPGKGVNEQTFLEFRLRRQELLAGKAGGLTAVGKDERDRSDMLDLGPRHDDEKHILILASCRNCHTDQGILSMNSYTGGFDNVGRAFGLRSLVEAPLDRQEDATIKWKQSQFSWGLLTGFKEGK